jgi:RNA polymerase sigma-70 factor (ECF subfamily)
MTTETNLNNVLPKGNGREKMGIQLAKLRRELFFHALRLTQNLERAEDLVQDTVERALRFSHRFEEGTHLRAWVHQVLRNLFISQCRKNRREGQALAALSHDPSAWTSTGNVSLESLRFSPGTQRAIDELPQVFRSAVWLIDVEDYSYRKAAEQLGVPLGTVMSRLHRGRRLLAEALWDPDLEARAA